MRNLNRSYWYVGKFALLLLLIIPFFSLAQDDVSSGSGDPEKGKSLFNAQCAACHKLDKKGVGPALRGVGQRLEREWLYKWIKNSAELIASGDAYANQIFEEYNRTPMNAFPNLSNADIDDILAYADQPKPEPTVAAVASDAASAPVQSSGISEKTLYGIVALVLLILAVVLYIVHATLKRFAEAQGIEIVQEEKKTPLWKAYLQNQFLIFSTVIVLLFGVAYYGYGFMMQIGVDQGYAPIQPIHFSHRIHAGENQIDCKYCHSSARVSKHSGIPSLNVCMNCHVNIAEVKESTATDEYSKEFYDAEIQKLYKATGWNPDEMAYTEEPSPVRWERIHNLPDFAYFNHAQHHMVGNIQCQTCHGPIEEMEIVYQYSPLTMGWCINCHRETNIDLAGNAYYEKIHEELKKKYGVDKLTVAQQGGLECGKCHY